MISRTYELMDLRGRCRRIRRCTGPFNYRRVLDLPAIVCLACRSTQVEVQVVLTRASLVRRATNGPPQAPASFYCPVSMELMSDPVIVATGHTYDRICIERWLQQGNRTCPVTGMRLRHLELTPNHALRNAIQVSLLHRPDP